MYDTTPAPFGDVTRRWTALDSDARQRHAVRLLSCDCPGDVAVHVDRPGLDAGICYRQLVPAAAAGDPIALGWLATTHRPLLVARGRALLDHDPTEWGAVCLEVLHRTLASADLSEVRWLRRRVARRLVARPRCNARPCRRRPSSGWPTATSSPSRTCSTPPTRRPARGLIPAASSLPTCTPRPAPPAPIPRVVAAELVEDDATTDHDGRTVMATAM